MIFNGDANKQDLCSLADRLVKTNVNRYPLTEKAQDATEGEKIIWSWIWEVYGGWVFDDTNQTSLPEATRDLPANTQFVVLPDIQDLLGVDWKDSGGNWDKLQPITLEQIKDMGYAESEFQNIPGNPIYYRPVANGFKMYPAADTARSQALRVQVSRMSLPFLPADTTHAPGFDTIFHAALSTYMALTYSKINSLPIAGGVMRGGFKTGLLADWGDWEDRIRIHYAARYRQMFPPTIKHRKNIVSAYVS